MRIAEIIVEGKRIPRKKGQPAGSKKHSDLYTDENPKGTIHGLSFRGQDTKQRQEPRTQDTGSSGNGTAGQGSRQGFSSGGVQAIHQCNEE